MANAGPDRDPTPRPSDPSHPRDGGRRGEHADLPRDHHPSDARSPEEYTETPGSHRKGRHGPATDVGA